MRTGRVAPLEHRGFRTILLLLTGVPVALLYLWLGILQPIVFGSIIGDFTGSYMPAAARLAAGHDPYVLCQSMGCLEPTGPQYVMPPVLAWMLQPLVGVPSHAVAIGVVLVLNASLGVFIWMTLRALKVRDWQLATLLALVAIAFEPTLANVDEGQVNLVLLALSGVWFWSWVEDRWWGGAALGAAVALKLIQGPVVLLVLWGRRWAMLAAGAAAGLVLWLIGAPQYLFEYLVKVLPEVSQGTGFFENHSPGGTLTRLFQPDSFLGAFRGSPPAARVATIGLALAVLVVTFAVVRSPSRSATGRALEAAAIVAATPLIATYSWGTHLVLLLLPMFVLIAWGVRRRDWLVVGLVAVSWLLIGPGHKWFQVLVASGYPNLVVLRLMAEFGVVALAALWLASLVAVGRERSADRANAAHEDGAENHEQDRAREDDAIAAIPVRSV